MGNEVSYGLPKDRDEEDGGGCCTRFPEYLKAVFYFILCCWCNCLGCPCCCWRKPARSTIGVDQRQANRHGYGGTERNMTGCNQVADRRYQGEPVKKQPKEKWKPFSSTPKTKINIKAGKGATIIAGASTLENAQIDVESGTGQNNIVALGQNGNTTVTTADGRLQKAAGGEYVHTPGTAITGGPTDRPEITYP